MSLQPMKLDVQNTCVNCKLKALLTSNKIMNAFDGSYNFLKGTTLNNVYMNVDDAKSSDISYTILTLPSNGDLFEIGNDVAITLPKTLDISLVHYSPPNPNFTGVDSFTFKAIDALGYASKVATNYINIKNIVAYDNSYSIVKNMNNITIDISAIDGDDDAITYKITSLPTNGLLTETNGDSITVNKIIDISSVNYTPNYNFIGPDSFTFNASDDTNTSNTATTSINVADPSVNNLLIWCQSGDTGPPDWYVQLKWNNLTETTYTYGYQSRDGSLDNIWGPWSDTTMIAANSGINPNAYYVNTPNHARVKIADITKPYDIRLVVMDGSEVVQYLESVAPPYIWLSDASGANATALPGIFIGKYMRNFAFYPSSGMPTWTISGASENTNPPSSDSSWNNVSVYQVPTASGQSGMGMLIPAYTTYNDISGDYCAMYYSSGLFNVWLGSAFSPGGTPADKHKALSRSCWIADQAGNGTLRTGYWGGPSPALIIPNVGDTTPAPDPVPGTYGPAGMPTGRSINDYVDNVNWTLTNVSVSPPHVLITKTLPP